MALAHRDLVVIGGSAGSIEPLKKLLGALPADFAATVLIVVHMGATSYLAAIFEKIARLRVKRASNGAKIERGHIYIAAPGRHLLLHDGHLLLRRGPRENAARPAIDPLFRSAAASFTTRVIGIVLSGGLNDGTAGLRAIKRCGGVAIVQDPHDAEMPDMPRSALKYVDADHCVPIAAMASLLAEKVRERAPNPVPVPLDIKLEAAIAAQEPVDMKDEDQLGERSPFTCPECKGALWEINDGGLMRYRCHVGHAYTAEAMLQAQAREVEKVLGTLLRSHQERAALVRRMAEQERKHQRGALAAQLERRAEEYEQDVAIVRRLIDETDGGGGEEFLSEDDATDH